MLLMRNLENGNSCIKNIVLIAVIGESGGDEIQIYNVVYDRVEFCF